MCVCSKTEVLCTKTFSCVGCVPVILLRTFSHLLIVFPENFNTVVNVWTRVCMCARFTHADTEPGTKNNAVTLCQTSTLIPIKHE